MTKSTPRIAFIRARWHADVVDRAHDGFLSEAATLMPGATVDAFDAPGAFEMPLLARKLAQTGRYDAVVAAALVVDGGIYRHDFVAQAVVSGLMQAGLETDVPCFSVSLTPHNYQETELLTGFYRDHFVKKGREAAHAVHATLTTIAVIAAPDRVQAA
ncbi:6,7-dimethyl-8-ribityllumazine synthase [Paracoccus sp. 1_MG-2023]|uniref:6,7-dimethyl-8-ribityllumazine synthase n=1 Tax=unclassified Paracoccus (in: a-proteobacteria) TaxID=2688777 RepID=UPI001C09959A|nr:MULTISPECIES: 6,7-dimethyl-8-ribityllumazine synthase [unclassified Paracoccus (in: a-proteobacteria)]MBU2958453.1 6,7-dimethyl-8-ribityllumazine synthase [Paracoccus sp. C2R09]MDO6668562.1 6,7-dimethyl-8-ribityllumazine synthase [Paracoccus sp. 1_MG-2023]